MREGNKILLVCGWGGSGKDYAVDLICEGNDLQNVKVQSYTTRQPRYEGEDTHTFIDDEFYEDCKINNKVIAYTYQNDAHYFTTIESLIGKKFYIIDKPGIEYFNKYYYENRQEFLNAGIDEFEVVYLNPCKIKVLYNLLFRRKISIKEAVIRMKQDKKLYSGMENIHKYEFKNQHDMIEFIQNYML